MKRLFALSSSLVLAAACEPWDVWRDQAHCAAGRCDGGDLGGGAGGGAGGGVGGGEGGGGVGGGVAGGGGGGAVGGGIGGGTDGGEDGGTDAGSGGGGGTDAGAGGGTGGGFVCPPPTGIPDAGHSCFAVAVTAQEASTCVRYLDAVRCFGSNDRYEVGAPVTSEVSAPFRIESTLQFADLAVGEEHSCGLSGCGDVICWGANTKGQLGRGSLSDTSLPMGQVVVSNATAVATGVDFSCAVVAGEARCWGENAEGQLGNPAVQSAFVALPITVDGLGAGVLRVAAGKAHACALMVGGNVKCWGSNASGQLGFGQSDGGSGQDAGIAHDVASLSNVVGLSAGFDHTCALLSDASIKCWGSNSSNKISNGPPVHFVPVAIDAGGPVSTVVAGNGHTCALNTTGTVMCWGYNAYGQAGTANIASTTRPTSAVAFGGGVVALGLGGQHTCVVYADGGAACAGRNHHLQLGRADAGWTTDGGAVPYSDVQAQPTACP